MGINKAAWAILSPDEKTSLGLQLGYQKSSWESGEIMDKSHYKYLEIKYRAEKFLAMFTEHLHLYKEVIPDYITGDGSVIKYLRWCIEERVKPMDAIERLNDNDNDKVYTKSGMNVRLVDQMRKWGRSENVYEQSIFNLALEFDRWNNFRILPREVQEPSAFKRRIKNMYKKHIRALTSIPKLSIVKLMELSKAKKTDHSRYMPLIHKGRGFKIHKVKTNKSTCKLYNELCFYIFKDKEEALRYIEAVFHYTSNKEKDCKDGIKFWQIYRESIKNADNYNEIQKITATRSHLEMAHKNLEFF